MSNYIYSTSSDIINNSIANEVYMNMQEHFTPTVAKAIAKNVQNKLKSNNGNKTNISKRNTTPKTNTPKRNISKTNTPKRNTPKSNTPKRNTPNSNTPKRQPNKKINQPKIINNQINNQINKQSMKQSKKNVISQTIPKSNMNVQVIKQSPKPTKVQPPKVQPPKVQPPKVQPPKVQPPKVQPPKVQQSIQPKINTNANLQITPVKPTQPKISIKPTILKKEKFSQNKFNNAVKNRKLKTPFTPSTPIRPPPPSSPPPSPPPPSLPPTSPPPTSPPPTSPPPTSPPPTSPNSTQKINNLNNKDTPTTPIQSTQSATIPLSSNVPKENIPTYIPKDEIQESILNLNIQKLVTLSLKAIMDTIADLTILYNSNRISIMNVLSIVLKDNRIMYLGTGFFMVSVAMYIFNNFLRIPSFGFGGLGERRVFINNY